MESLFKRLLGILAEEKELYEALLELSAGKKESIVSNDLKAINKVVLEEQAIVAKIQDRERARIKCSADLERLSGKKNANLQSFARLAFTQEDKDKLEELQTTLPDLITRLRSLNETNRRLVESRLKYVKFVMDNITQTSDAAVYGAQGEENVTERPRPNLYDQKV